MEFENEFEVKAALESVWATMLDVERVAPCVPGAQVLERTGEDAYKVGIKVKVGPVSMQYRGEVEIVEKDPSSHSAVMSARAREARGQGTANANVRMHLSGNGDTTKGTMITEVQLSGRAAAMGQGVIKDVSARIVDQFSENLAAMLAGGGEQPAPEAPAAEPAPAKPAAEGEGSAAAREATEERAEPAANAQGLGAPTAPTPSEPATPPSEESFDALALASGMAADRMRDPRVLFGTLGLVALVFYLLGRRRG